MKFKAYLEKKKITRLDASKALGVSTVAIGYWCRGLRVPSKAKMATIYNWTRGKVGPADFYGKEFK